MVAACCCSGLKELFKSIDEDKSGTITVVEVSNFVVCTFNLHSSFRLAHDCGSGWHSTVDHEISSQLPELSHFWTEMPK